MSGFQEFSFGQGDENIGQRVKRFKAEAGRTYRASMAWWAGIDDGELDLSGNPKFTGAPRNFIDGVGYVINKGPEYTKLAGEPPRMAIATIFVNWPMTTKGTLDKTALANGEFVIQPWVFSSDKYKKLDLIHKEFPLGEHDLKMMCEDTQFQKITFSPCKDSLLEAFKKKGGKTWKRIIAEVQAVAADIRGVVGRELSLDEIREKLGGGGGGGGSTAASMATEDIDSLVDNLLED